MKFAILVGIIAIAASVNSATITEARESKQAQEVAAGVVTCKESIQPDICLTKGCVKAASSVLEKMNLTADPCEDFFEFSCGSFVQNTPIPEEKSSVTAFSEVNDQLILKLRTVVEQPISAKDTAPIKMVKNLFQSCMNVEEIEKLGVKPVVGTLRRMGGWPVLEGAKWDEATFSWQQAVYNNRKEGYSVDYLIDFSVGTDIKNSSWRVIWLDQATLGLSREYLVKGMNDSDVKAYVQYAVDLAVLLGADKVRAEKEMAEVIEFEIKLANITTRREERRNLTKLYNPYTLKELTEQVPDIPFTTYVNTIMVPSIQVTENETVIVSNINYLKNLTTLLAMTPKRTIANYLLFRVTKASATYLTEDIRAAQLKYSKVLTGTTKRPPRWKECIAVISSRLSYAVSNLYVTNFFNEEAKQQAVDMVNYIRNEFDETLNTITWMDPITRKNALSKSKMIKSRIGYPQEVKQASKIMEHYRDLKITNGSILNNMLRSHIFTTNYSFSKLREQIDKNDWKRHGNVAVVNAFYSALVNSIVFPAGILQGAFFEPDRPKYMNFASIGFVIGHEITHGFDDQGKQFDENGDLKNWWEVETEKKFLQKAKCIIDQYANYTMPENNMKLNGINTQGENIADNGGIKEAYAGYVKWAQDNPKEGVLPGLMEYTNKQLFWVSAAQIWCSRYRPQALKVRILTGVHSPGRFRIKGSFSNSESFAADWQCPLGTNMNPAKKCTVW